MNVGPIFGGQTPEYSPISVGIVQSRSGQAGCLFIGWIPLAGWRLMDANRSSHPLADCGPRASGCSESDRRECRWIRRAIDAALIGRTVIVFHWSRLAPIGNSLLQAAGASTSNKYTIYKHINNINRANEESRSPSSTGCRS